MKELRRLLPDEIELKVQTINEKGAVLVPFINRTAAINILNESFGVTGWEIPENAYRIQGNCMTCMIRIYDEDKKEWISKVDGTSYSSGATEDKDVKGQLSDAFKRTVMTIGLGTELSTSPFIWISADKMKMVQRNGKYATYDKFVCTDIDYSNNNRITKMEITNQSTGQVVFTFENKIKSVRNKPAVKDEQREPVKETIKDTEVAGTMNVPLAPATNSNPGDYILPVGFAKGKSIARLYEMQEPSVKKTKGDAFRKLDVFEWYINNVSDEEVLDAIKAFCA